MDPFHVILFSVLTLFISDQLGLWMERKGWLQWSYCKPATCEGMDRSFQELNTFKKKDRNDDDDDLRGEFFA